MIPHEEKRLKMAYKRIRDDMAKEKPRQRPGLVLSLPPTAAGLLVLIRPPLNTGGKF